MAGKHRPKLAVLCITMALALVALATWLGSLPPVVSAQGPDDGVGAQEAVGTAASASLSTLHRSWPNRALTR